MDYNKLFEQDAFKAIDNQILEQFKVLINNIKDKDSNEVILNIMNFYNSIPKNSPLSKEQSDALMQAIILNLEENERKRFLSMLELVSNII